MLVRNTVLTYTLILSLAVFSKVLFLVTFAPSQDLPLMTNEGVQALLYGLKFDLAVTSLLIAPIFLLTLMFSLFNMNIRSLLKLFTCILSVWVIMTTCSDAIYVQDADKHVTFELFTAQGTELELLHTSVVSYWPTLLLGIVVSALAVYGVMRWCQLSANTRERWPVKLLFSVFWILVTVTAIRGGWKDAPQSPMSVYNIGSTNQAHISWSAPYSITYYLINGEKKAATKITKDPSAEELDVLNSMLSEQLNAEVGQLKDANVLIFLLESWAAYDMQSYAQNENVTPFFDQLRKQTLTSHAAYADGYRTVQGMFATLCSYPNPNAGIIPNTQLQNAKYECLPNMLASQGWETMFIQGSGKGKVGSFAQTLGYEHSFGKSDYDFDYEHNEWGYMDGGIYQFTLQKLANIAHKQDKPFFMTVNTGTTHGTHLPEDYGYKFGRDTVANERRSVLHYADKELSQFFPNLNAMLQQLTRPTLVLFVADHTAKITEGDFAKNSIPFVLYASDGSIPAQKLPIAVSQRDLGATVLDWLGGKAPWFTGRSLLDQEYKGRASFSSGTSFFWLTKDNAVSINSTTGKLEQCFDIADDTIARTEVSCDVGWAQALYKEGNRFNIMTQHLLFAEKTTGYRQVVNLIDKGK